MMTTPFHHKHRPQGAAMLFALMFVLVATIALTAFSYLLGARVMQAQSMSNSSQRHIAWGNMQAIQQQYAMSWALRDKLAGADGTGSTRASSAATPVASWGGVTAAAYTGLKAFRSTNLAAGGTSAYPFNNIVPLATSTKDVYFERIGAESDATQTTDVSLLSYLKTYPPSLLGDLFIVHRRPTGTNGYYLSDNIQVNGRVVVMDETAEVANLRALSCLNLTKTGTNTTDSTATTPAPILPQNLPSTPRITNGGYGASLTGTTSATAVTNGTLNLVHNDTFAPNSIRNKLEAMGTSAWYRISHTTLAATTTPPAPASIQTYQTYGSTSSDIQIRHDTTTTAYGLAPSPCTQSVDNYSSATSSRINVLIVRLGSSALTKHIYIESGVEQLIIEGSTSSSGYNNANGYSTIIIACEQTNLRDIRFVGENNRRFILALKGPASPTNGTEYYCDFVSNATTSSGNNTDLDWRINWINENRRPYIDVNTSGLKLRIKGGMRTDRDVNFVPSGSDARVFFDMEDSPGTLLTMLPRDGWIEPYFIAQ